MNKYFLIFFLAVTEVVFSQEKRSYQLYSLTVLDSTSKTPLQGVTISLNKKIFLTNEVGKILISNASIRQGDSLRITSVGYNPVFVFFRTNSLADTICLVPSVLSLNEVKINSERRKDVTLGIVKKSFKSHRITSPNTEYLLYIPNDKKVKGTISTIEYVLNDVMQGINKPFKVGIYMKNRNDLFPGAELLKDTLIVQNPQKRTNVKVDVSGYNITLPENGVIVSFQTLPYEYYVRDSVLIKKSSSQMRWMLKLPGIDMDLVKKDSYTVGSMLLDKTTPYSMLINVADKGDPDALELHSYVYADGNNYAISIVLDPD